MEKIKIEGRMYLMNIKIPIDKKEKIIEETHSKLNMTKDEQNYNTQTLIILFFLSAFIGWIWEVILEVIDSGKLVNKGVLIGPYLPIYGFGCLFILLLFSKTKLKNLAHNFFVTFLLVTLTCTILEYCGSVYLETVYGMRWWDYSNIILNFQGRISLITSILFGIAGSFGLYYFAPYINKRLLKISNKVLEIICLILISVFVIDNIYCLKHPNSGEGITTVVIEPETNIDAYNIDNNG